MKKIFSENLKNSILTIDYILFTYTLFNLIISIFYYVFAFALTNNEKIDFSNLKYYNFKNIITISIIICLSIYSILNNNFSTLTVFYTFICYFIFNIKNCISNDIKILYNFINILNFILIIGFLLMIIFTYKLFTNEDEEFIFIDYSNIIHNMHLFLDTIKINYNSFIINCGLHKLTKKLLFKPKDYYFLNQSNIKKNYKKNNNNETYKNKNFDQSIITESNYSEANTLEYSRLDDEEEFHIN